MKRLIARPTLFLLFTASLCFALLPGCSVLTSTSRNAYKYAHPTLAVYRFDNKAGGSSGWDLGNGMADVMVNSLIHTGRFTVVERQNLDAILRELDLQHGDITRPEGKLRKQRIINVQYLIKGTVTDFSHIGSGGVGIGVKSTHIRGGGNTAVVSIVVSVIDVETGEILLSTTKSSKVHARRFDVAAAYKDIAFGGDAFSRTPLGKATARAIDDAVADIVRSIGSIPWFPAVVEIQDADIVVNGGEDRRLKPGMLFYVMEPGDEIYDPETGNLLGTTPGRKVGVIELTRVFEKFSYACLRDGRSGEAGSRLVRIKSSESPLLDID